MVPYRTFFKIKGHWSMYLKHLTYGGVEVKLHSFLTSTTDGSEWLTSRLCQFTSKNRARGAQ